MPRPTTGSCRSNASTRTSRSTRPSATAISIPIDYDGAHFDWPRLSPAVEDPAAIDHARAEYAALVSMCDGHSAGCWTRWTRIDLWDDTLLIVCTDHGFLLGEHGWWGKNAQPWYNELAQTPLFVWDPRSRAAGRAARSLVQTIDFAPTLLEFFGVAPTADMQGRAGPGPGGDGDGRASGLFGILRRHMCPSPTAAVSTCAPDRRPENGPLFEYTLMPTRILEPVPPRRIPRRRACRALHLHQGAEDPEGPRPRLRRPAEIRDAPVRHRGSIPVRPAPSSITRSNCGWSACFST